jgi:2-keto-myo-inositol isomerase
MNRRNLLKASLASGLLLELSTDALAKKTKHNFTFSLNTSTIREQKIGLMAELELAAKVGYNGIEIWMDTLQSYLKTGGTTAQLRSKAQDLGLKIEDVIGFAPWIVEDKETRTKGLEQAKVEMNLLAEIGCKRMAAPPVGAQTAPKIELKAVADRFGVLSELGDSIGVNPQLELWGFSTNLSKMGEVLYVAAEANRPNTAILADVYHLYKGGSAAHALDSLSASQIEIFHVNDYPLSLSPSQIVDANRVHLGQGGAPLKQIFQMLHAKKTPIVLSLELFNKDYYKQPALQVATEGLQKMKLAVTNALA